MPEARLKTGILGLNETGQVLLEAACGVDYLQIEAVADKDAELAERLASEHKCTAYDDYRQLVIQNQLDCLLVAAGLYSCDEYVRAAIKKKFNVLKAAPAGRGFEEAAELVRLAEDEGVKFAVANWCRFAKSYLALRDFLQQGRIENVFLVTGVCTAGDKAQPGWHSDPKLAGGGVLLRDCYELVDEMVSNFGVPGQVYSVNTNQAGDRQKRLYLTEDTALVTLKFTDTFIGNLVASNGFGPGEELLKVYGKDKILTAGSNQFTVSDGVGHIEEERRYGDDELCCMKKLLENFALSILAPEENQLVSSGRENLKNMAVIESAYLSARTGMAEEPGRIFQMGSVP